MAEKDFLKKTGALKKEIAALREKSEVLTDRAEDIFIPPRIKESRPNSFYMINYIPCLHPRPKAGAFGKMHCQETRV